ncbi:UDP-glucose 4-epimerase GalE [Oscillospiraceae bacterium HV4-5-C5C]|nr:UDP-glucose 4-epimerase GalE [Oscillospiraceae bacterium HV4-5-C5C]
MPTVLTTGGTGYIGSHTLIELIQAGYKPVVVDNLVNSSREVLRRVEKITGQSILFYEGDVRDRQLMDRVFSEQKIDAVIHFAGLKAVGESVGKPLEYYDNNLYSTLVLCETMRRHGCKCLVFSSSATVYGTPDQVPITEDESLSCTNPYGWSKLMNEQILGDVAKADPEWSVLLLRYFNPIGAHHSGLIGEQPNGIPNNLMPYITQVAIGKLSELHVYGDDYDTVDGTGVRDYIHVVDLARGHVAAIRYALAHKGSEAINLGTGLGLSVLQLKSAFEKASGIKIPYVIDPRRPGDIASCYADPSKAKALLNWTAEKDVDDMCRDSWRWQKNNPQGYANA